MRTLHTLKLSIFSFQIRIYARKTPVKNKEVDYAADISPIILDTYSVYLKEPYSLPKSGGLLTLIMIIGQEISTKYKKVNYLLSYRPEVFVCQN